MIALWIVLGRYWKVELFGYFNYLFAYISIVGIFFDFGLDVLLTRIISKNPENHIPNTCWQLKLKVFLIVIILSGIIGSILSFPADSLICLLIGITLLSFTSFFNAIFRARDELHIEAKIGLIQKVLFISVTIIGVIYFDQYIIWLSIAYLSSHLLAFILTISILYKKQWLRLNDSPYPSQYYLQQSWPLFTSALLAVLSMRLDIFLLQWLRDIEQIGYYTAATRLFEGITIVSTAFIAVVFPKFVAKSHNIAALKHFFKYTATVLGGAGLLIIIPGLFLIPTIITTLYGSEFSPSIALLQMLLPTLFFVFLTNLSGNLLIAIGKQHLYMKILALMLLIQATVNLISINLLGAMGAIIGFWIREICLFIILSFLILQIFKTDKVQEPVRE